MTFGGSSGWRRALQRFVDMNDAAASSRGLPAYSGAAQRCCSPRGKG